MTDSNLARATRLLLAGVFAGALVSFAAAADAANVTVLYSFQNNGKDGFTPAASLTEVNGILYGTTDFGGTGRCQNGCGTIFSVDPSTGAETILHSFSEPGQTTMSPGSLVAEGSTLYGTTRAGGHREAGMLFSVDLTSGKFNQKYYFCNLENCSDGEDANPGLLNKGDTLYGTTYGGGLQQCNCGTVFSFDPKTQSETVLHAFDAAEGDGEYPMTGVLNLNRKLYGTTNQGGAYGYGTAFVVDRITGAESVVYAFCSQPNCTDGSRPTGNLISLNNILYGTTESGGASGVYGYGTVFSIDPATHAEAVLYSFGGSGLGDGAYPDGLIYVNGLLYGTTASGGANCVNGCGTVYSVDPQTGAEAVVYSFCNQVDCADGVAPQSTLLNVNGTLYGVTSYGGNGTCTGENELPGCGTVFAITP